MIIHYLLLVLASVASLIAAVQGGRNCGPNPSQIYLKRGDKSSVEYWVPPPEVDQLQSRNDDDYQDDQHDELSATGLTTWRINEPSEPTTIHPSVHQNFKGLTVSVPDGSAESSSAGTGLKVTSVESSNDDVTTSLPLGVNDQLQQPQQQQQQQQADGAEFQDVVTESETEQQGQDVTESSSANRNEDNVQDFTQSPEEINMQLTAGQQQQMEDDIHTKTAVMVENIMKQEEFRPLMDSASTEAHITTTTEDSITVDSAEFSAPTSQAPDAIIFEFHTTQEPGIDSIQIEISRHPEQQSISNQLQNGGDIQDITHILMQIPSVIPPALEADSQIKELESVIEFKKGNEPETVTIIDFKNDIQSAVDIHSEEIDQNEIRPEVVAISPVTEQPETFTDQPSDTKLIPQQFTGEGSGFDPVEIIEDPVTQQSIIQSDEMIQTHDDVEIPNQTNGQQVSGSDPIEIIADHVATIVHEASGSDPIEILPVIANDPEGSGSDPVEIIPVIIPTNDQQESDPVEILPATNDQEGSGSDPVLTSNLQSDGSDPVEIIPVIIPTNDQQESDPVEILPATNDQEGSGSDPVPVSNQQLGESEPVEIIPVIIPTNDQQESDPVEILPAITNDPEGSGSDPVSNQQLGESNPVEILPVNDPVEILPSATNEKVESDSLKSNDQVEILPVEISSTAQDGSGADPIVSIPSALNDGEGSGSDPVENLAIVEKSTTEGSGTSDEPSIASIDRSDNPEEIISVVEDESPPEFRNDDILINRIRTIVNSLTNPRETSSLLFRRTSDLISSVFKRNKRSEPSNPAEIINSPAFQRFLRSQPLPIRRALSPNFSGRFSRQMDSDIDGPTSQEQEDDECDLHIKTDPGLHLLLTFHNMSAPYTVDCAGAYVEIEREGNGFEARWCGNPIGQRGVRSHVIFARSEVRVSVYNNKNTLLQYQIHSPGEGNNSLDPLTQPTNDDSVPTGFRADIEVIDLHDAGQYKTFQRSEAYSNVHRKIG